MKAASIKKHTFSVPDQSAGLRLDQAVGRHLPDLSRETAKKFIALGAVWINERRVQILSTKVRAGDAVSVYIGREGCRQFYEINPENILYEDQWLLLYRKEPGVPSQGLVCDNYNNVYAALTRYCRKKTATPYLGLHHRLDLDTSGVLLFTLSARVNRSIHYQFKDHRVRKTYLALVRDNPPFQETTCTSFIGRRDGKYVCSGSGPGKIATTVFRRLNDYPGYSAVRAEPETGRTHQIRLQLAFLGFPILGDRLYGHADAMGCERTMLHAESLTVFHPIQKKNITVQAELFEDMQRLMR